MLIGRRTSIKEQTYILFTTPHCYLGQTSQLVRLRKSRQWLRVLFHCRRLRRRPIYGIEDRTCQVANVNVENSRHMRNGIKIIGTGASSFPVQCHRQAWCLTARYSVYDILGLVRGKGTLTRWGIHWDNHRLCDGIG
ncbi:hypothetical protein PV05_04953 [Exophiala xenobiotica]|uniref:Uncharacterized protein n=1 Tax=Exophiala xenobiotica TaxID=348802 RepID=A0A0D2ELF6_9EURO|nr:uncharacterized protein PV05_04953 [Exophiala xenobiotica]KIW56283.1 hypothetical protein PV05_04953 [Exophiala xenobiotica]